MKSKDIIIRVLKKAYRITFNVKFQPPVCNCDRQSSNDEVYNLLATGKPCMIARFGTTELTCLVNYVAVHKKAPFIKKYLEYITGYCGTPWWNESHFQTMSLWSGIFPPSQDTAERFSQRYMEDIPLIDLLACHQYTECHMPLRDDIKRVQLEMLYPFFVERPWTRILKGKKVLVIHPFEETIKTQYGKRKLIFKNEDILPDFELKTLKAVQTVANTKSEFKDWFEALHWMENEINKIDFDIAIIGCGAYGLPLAAHIKRMGKQAIHMGGGTQLMFGILGNRWVKQYPSRKVLHYRDANINLDYTPLFNSDWIYPLDCDTIKNAQVVEGACYWK
jgi:hypothetical protein